MSLTTVNDAPAAQTVSGQPATSTPIATASTDVVDTSTTTTTETPTATDANASDGAAAPANADGATPQAQTNVDVNISPEALRQITKFSADNRKLRNQLKELETKHAAATAAPPTDVTEKLKRLEQLEEAIKSPRKYLALANKSLEDVAKDILSEDEVERAADPRVDAIAPVLDGVKKELEALKEAQKAREAAQTTSAQSQQLAQMTEHIKTVITAGSDRWERVAKDTAQPEEIVKAASMIVERDYAEKKDESGKVIKAAKALDQATANKILETCLDEAEAMLLAREIVAQRKNGGHQSETVVRKRGIEILADGASEKSAPKPKPTADDTRGPTRTVAVPRGPTDVRTARARALKMVDGGR